jgi:hypothetical protein
MRPHIPHEEGSRSPADLRLIRNDGAAVALRWRAFGDRGDLDLDFRSAARTPLVTELLARCRQDVSNDIGSRLADARRLTLSGRIGGLAVILARTISSSDIVVELRCPIEGCRAALQASLSLAALLELSQHAEIERSLSVRLSDAESVDVRRPTGEDQHAWQMERYQTLESAERAMVESLLVGAASLSPSTLSAIDTALEEADPLTCFRIATVCPSCAEESDYALDLEAVLLARLHRAQRSVLHDIHRLATRYGWSEETIAALPSWRRREYLEFIDRGDA